MTGTLAHIYTFPHNLRFIRKVTPVGQRVLQQIHYDSQAEVLMTQYLLILLITPYYLFVPWDINEKDIVASVCTRDRSQELIQLDARAGNKMQELFFVGLCICFISEVHFLQSIMERMQKPRDILNWFVLFLSKSENPLIAQNSRERLYVSKPEPPVNCQLLCLLRSFVELHKFC